MSVNAFYFSSPFTYSSAQSSPSELSLVQETREPSLGSQGRGTVGSAPHSIGQDDLMSSGSWGTSASSLAGGSQAAQCSYPVTASRRRPRPPQDPFIIIGAKTAKRGRNGPPPGIPILVRVPQAVPGPGPSKGYATGTVFWQETLTPKSFFFSEDDISTKSRRLSAKTETESRKHYRRASSKIQAPETPTYAHLTLEEFLELIENNPIQWIYWTLLSTRGVCKC